MKRVTDIEIAKQAGIPKDTLSRWKVRKSDDWRYRLYESLKASEEFRRMVGKDQA